MFSWLSGKWTVFKVFFLSHLYHGAQQRTQHHTLFSVGLRVTLSVTNVSDSIPSKLPLRFLKVSYAPAPHSVNCFALTKSLRKGLLWLRVWVKVHHGQEGTARRRQGSWLHCISSQEVKWGQAIKSQACLQRLTSSDTSSPLKGSLTFQGSTTSRTPMIQIQ